MVNALSRAAVTATFICLFIVPAARAQEVLSPAAPEPTQLRDAKIVYLSNVGLDASSLAAFFTLARTKTDMPFNNFYSAMKSWGHFGLPGDPRGSDLVLEFRVESALSTTGRLTVYSTFLSVAILDTSTHFILRTIKMPLEVNRSFDQNVSTSVAHILDVLKGLTLTANMDVKK
jgi:hypothetical protein